ncbi:hypothetical protein CBG46_07155 [Actinobacillus succinogenes]|uniref:Prepilin peptidase dependent protein C n=1 Tax=Actinobacillus succinogenes (strain ATCC 55618 / DSM 22257 / CCUG 43843 / 130Z) TaxID=339671 RepID=A6VQ91_ACTSZ|nr:DUF5374 domain-containing protein [Actinobacillus succinogenes]ABR75138.1 conserved hypothetical protein [Actinobacillus succinogenes 130Z]PHI40465.1 hypothetical protein CBG46_07155 [Actinobacillus succinogenes]
MTLLLSRYGGMSLLTLIISLTLFSGIFMSISQWSSYQRKIAINTYQRYQAIQIAENQKQRQFLHLPCENIVEQNQLKFSVQCTDKHVIVRYPAGELYL